MKIVTNGKKFRLRDEFNNWGLTPVLGTNAILRGIWEGDTIDEARRQRDFQNMADAEPWVEVE
jgi:hypothetical protein